MQSFRPQPGQLGCLAKVAKTAVKGLGGQYKPETRSLGYITALKGFAGFQVQGGGSHKALPAASKIAQSIVKVVSSLGSSALLPWHSFDRLECPKMVDLSVVSADEVKAMDFTCGSEVFQSHMAASKSSNQAHTEVLQACAASYNSQCGYRWVVCQPASATKTNCGGSEIY